MILTPLFGTVLTVAVATGPFDGPGRPPMLTAQQKVAATATLQGGSTYPFNAAVQRQRPGLVEANDNIYAGFGSFCDYDQDQTRGWLIGWQADTLKTLPAAQLNDQLTSLTGTGTDDHGCSQSNVSCWLSAVWMSGYAVAADAQGNLYFSTGNSAWGSYQPNLDLQESVIQMPPDLHAVGGVFTPNDEQSRDYTDQDLGSGGVLLLPDQPGMVPHLAVVAGKISGMYLLNRDQLGGLSGTPNTSNLGPATDISGDCWCGESYFVAPDGLGRIVSSGGTTVGIWTVQTSATANPQLLAGPTASLAAGGCHDGGFFTSVSSSGTSTGSAVVWAVNRGSPPCLEVSLYAFDPSSGSSVLPSSLTAGYWPAPNANPNIVPVVSNGKVYVASYDQVAIFGLGASGTAQILKPLFPAAPAFRHLFGTVKRLSGSIVTLALRSGKEVAIDVSLAERKRHTVPVKVGDTIGVVGLAAAQDQVLAWRSYHLAGEARSWPADRSEP